MVVPVNQISRKRYQFAQIYTPPKNPPQPCVSWKTRIRMLKEIDSLTGRFLSLIVKITLILIVSASFVCCIYLLLQSAMPLINNSTDSAIKPKEILELLLSFLTLIVTMVTAFQVYMMKDINQIEMSHKVFEDNQYHRKNMHNAHLQLQKLANAALRCDNFDDIYPCKSWKDLRAFAFHYEYMGYLVFRNRLNFDIVFDTVAFPNWLIASEDAKAVIYIGKKETPDFWNGATYLYLCYELRRKYNKLKALRADLRAYPFWKIWVAKRGLCKKQFLASKEYVPPVQKDFSAENILKNLWLTEHAFQEARQAWKKHCATMPY